MNSLVSELILENKGRFENSRDCNIRQYKTYGMTVKRQLYTSDTKERYFHLFYSDHKAVSEREQIDVGMVISKLEICDQVWFVRYMPPDGEHSMEAISLVKEVVARLEEIPDGCAECIPFDTIDELKRKYLLD